MCDYAFYGSLAVSIDSIGQAVFIIPIGMLSDHYGRRWIPYISLFIIITVAFASAFSTKYWHFLISRLISCGVTAGVISTISTLSGELVGPRWRPLSQNLIWIAFTFHLLVLTLMAYFVRTWRTLAILCSAPWIFVFVFAKWVVFCSQMLFCSGNQKYMHVITTHNHC